MPSASFASSTWGSRAPTLKLLTPGASGDEAVESPRAYEEALHEHELVPAAYYPAYLFAIVSRGHLYADHLADIVGIAARGREYAR